jgi:hypothetical protein
MSHAKHVRCRCLKFTVWDNKFFIHLYGNITVPKKNNNRSNIVKNMKSRPVDIKIKFSIRNYTPSPNFKSVCQKTQEWRSNYIKNIKSRSVDIKIHFVIRIYKPGSNLKSECQKKVFKNVGQMVSIIPKNGQLVSKLNSTSKITQITPLVQISSLYIKDKKSR